MDLLGRGTVSEYDFHERLTFSKGIVAATCKETIQNMIPGCVKVTAAPEVMDKTGIDYVATLRRGTVVFIDHKARERGCSQYWRPSGDDRTREPELALELWSVRPTNGRPGRAGWTLDEAKRTHYTLHTFHQEDSREAYLLPFQLLRKAYRAHFRKWNETYHHGVQNSGTWESECVFIPACIILDALSEAMQGIVVA